MACSYQRCGPFRELYYACGETSTRQQAGKDFASHLRVSFTVELAKIGV